MMRYVRAGAWLAWKAYVIFCVFLISSYIVLMTLMLASRRFDAVQLPNGAYMAHRHFFSWDREDIVLLHPNGKVLVNESIEWVCFNERFVEGNTYYGPKPDFSIYTSRRFIYEKGQDEAFFNVDPRYYEVEARSDLEHENGCGINRFWTGFYMLLRDPKYRR